MSLLSSSPLNPAGSSAQPQQSLLPDELPDALAFVQAAAQRSDDGHFDELHAQPAGTPEAGTP
ncbi:hypothetical protein, partial [Ideonella azotifigens]|uniref:hypothetical protein n=1 Tax=Ideonella azotifigens TaxID=513160 RepID=UPI0011442237